MMRFAIESLYIALGAAIGANARYWLHYLTKATTQSFPWTTLGINVVGSLLLGAFAAGSLAKGLDWQWRVFFAVGLCGGFTTFSTFSFEFLNLVYERSWRAASLYALMSVTLCVGACFLGGHLARLAFGLDETPRAAQPYSRPGKD